MGTTKLRRLEVDMLEILEALTMHGPGEPSAVLDLQTGEVAWVRPEELRELEGEADEAELRIFGSPERYVEIPEFEGRQQYRLMVQFADSLEDEDLRERLHDALDGRGAFGRFRGLVYRWPDTAARWNATLRDALEQFARSWLESLELEPVYHLPDLPAPEPPSAAAPPRAQPAIGLLDLLLLGDPEGRTERVDGRLHRSFRAESGQRARKIFRTLARELCDLHGLAWRRGLIEGKDKFEVERVRLELSGRTVEVWVTVPDEVWLAFSGEPSPRPFGHPSPRGEGQG